MAGATDILIEVQRRLKTIVQGNTTPHGTTYNFTPSRVAIGPFIARESDTWPVYNILRGINDAEVTAQGNGNRNEIVVAIDIHYSITRNANPEDDNPYEPFEQCVADAKAALFDKRNRKLIDDTGTVLSATWALSSTEINIDSDDYISDARIEIIASLTSANFMHF